MSLISFIIIIDQQIQNLILNLRGPFWNKFFLIFTKLGEWWVIGILFILVSAVFILYKKKNLILPFFITVLGSGIMTLIIKFAVNRTRPGADFALYLEKLPSFPSAHAALAVALFGFVIFSVWILPVHVTLKITKSIFCLAIILLIGFSRIYLGVHYTSDVVAGYLTGLLWLLIGMYLAKKI